MPGGRGKRVDETIGRRLVALSQVAVLDRQVLRAFWQGHLQHAIAVAQVGFVAARLNTRSSAISI